VQALQWLPQQALVLVSEQAQEPLLLSWPEQVLVPERVPQLARAQEPVLLLQPERELRLEQEPLSQ
jgi:hypothetical protein